MPTLHTVTTRRADPRPSVAVRPLGVAMTANLAAASASQPRMNRLGGQIAAALAAGHALALRPTFIGGTEPSAAFLMRFIAALRTTDAPLERLELTLPAPIVLHDDLLARLIRLGVAVNVVLTRPHLDARGWTLLWQQRGNARVRTALYPLVRSTCSLLADEAAYDVAPKLAMHVPPETAWLHARIDLAAFASAQRGIDRPALAAALVDVLEAAERRHDRTAWPTPHMQQDAWLNRRVVVECCGLGRCIATLGLAATNRNTLPLARSLMAFVRNVLLGRSRALAARYGALPVIALANPCPRIPVAAGRARWQRRWRSALEQHATRHRVVLAMSPWSLLEPVDPCPTSAGLLPVMACADALIGAHGIRLDAWNVNDFKSFHRLSLAAVRARRETPPAMG